MQNTPFPQPICDQIWNGKYRLITSNPEIKNDNSVSDTWTRIATACANSNLEVYGAPKLPKNLNVYKKNWEDKFYSSLEDFKFLPAGRITAGAGSNRSVTLFNCYVMGTIPDSMDGIFDMLKEAALTMQQGGGIGYDFSTLRPKNSPVKKLDADASGPVSFMDIWDAMCRTIMSAGGRRGAMMATMRCDHPDVEDFITAKRDSKRLRMFNLSVLVTDAFMHAVESDSEWVLMHEHAPKVPVVWGDTTKLNGKHFYKIVKARDLWNLIMESTYNYAEPGVLFIDQINDMNNLSYMERISATNPCGEQPLPPYGACLLGSINLPKMVINPFSPEAQIDMKLLEDTTRVAVRMLDSVIDISNFPLPQQLEEAKTKRRMGLGVTGLADMLIMLKLRYGSTEAALLAEKVMKAITITAYQESIELAKEFGPCPATDTPERRQSFIESGFMRNMPTEIKENIIKFGIRNALLTSIAPTGTISIYAGNVSSGIEPIFATSYIRKVLENDGVTRREELVEDYAVKLYGEFCDTNGLDKSLIPNWLVTAQTLSPQDHLVMQAAIQKWVDSSISKTINCPIDISFSDFQNIYMSAWKMKCKGCTTYRPNDVTGSVLSVEPKKKEDTSRISSPEPLVRPQDLMGHTYKLKWENANIYVTINDYTDDRGRIIPFEIFINSKEMAHFQWTVALTRMMSAVFRRGGDISFVIDELKGVFDPNGGAFVGGKYIPSFIALLGQVLQTHLGNIGYLEVSLESVKEIPATPAPVKKPIQCTQCKGFNVNISSGCPTCGDCGYSKCG